MQSRQNKICIFDIDNVQADYALCLQFIKTNENKEISADEKWQLLRRLKDLLNITAGDINAGVAIRYLESPLLSTSENIQSGIFQKTAVMNAHKFGEKDLHDVIYAGKNISYHIRVHLDKSKESGKIEPGEFINLQYLALLIKNLDKQTKDDMQHYMKRRLSVFIVPFTGDTYPFRDNGQNIDCDSYLLVSQYLRLLTKEYTGMIYGVVLEKDDKTASIKPLDYANSNKYENYFPVLQVDREKYELLFNKDIEATEYEALFTIKKRQRFGASRDEDPRNAYKDAMLETAVARIRGMISDERMKTDEIVKRMLSVSEVLLKEPSGSPIQFCLFAFMLQIDDKEEEWGEIIRYTWHLSSEVCQGLKQIVQNSIQHSVWQSCFFSFYLHKSHFGETCKEFCDRCNYQDTVLMHSDKEGCYEALEVYIADLNEEGNMVTNFAERLKVESSIENDNQFMGHKKLLKQEGRIAIRNFFAEFENDDLLEEWTAFRQQDLVAHVGLSLFALTAHRCKASVKVISNSTFKLSEPRNYFYKSYSKTNNNQKEQKETKREEYVIPGTQFAIFIPIHEWEEDTTYSLGQLQRSDSVKEDYTSFAKYLDYDKSPIFITKRNTVRGGNSDITDAGEKFKLVTNWTNFWIKKINGNIETIHDKNKEEKGKGDKYVFVHDFTQVYHDDFFKRQDNMEVCIKGLIGALYRIRQYGAPFLLALTNLPEGTLEAFKKTCILLGVREFPINLQLFLCEINHENMMTLMGSNFVDAIYNSHILSLEHRINGFEQKDYIQALELRNKLLMHTETRDLEQSETDSINVFPFDAVLQCSQNSKKTFFEEHVEKMVENNLDRKEMGYKLENTHMRLGSKVHIESFYEMSFFFYRTTIANRIAYIILRRMALEKQWKDICSDTIIFYGYASHSKAILTSLTEILRMYREELSDGKGEEEDKVGFIAYQHNLYTESEETQLYYGLPNKFPGDVRSGNILHLQETVKIIQIVPISTTLTTFNKMWSKLFNSIERNDRKLLDLKGNYTWFWVVDIEGNLEKGEPSKIEAKYWEKAVGERKVQTKFKDLSKRGYGCVDYFIYSAVKWHDPLKCKLCYPDNIIDEIPLVETDQTSSVPSQQIRYSESNEIDTKERNKININDNNKRLLKLKGCVAYGHISRRQNHYQYYIDTQKYFYQMKKEIKEWLIEKRKGSLKSGRPRLNIIFSPEHNTNVGFAQYVNTYYFNGLAEIVSFNVDKEFRSNFKCEHAALIQMIEKLHQGMEGKKADSELPVSFYFVDDTIITGETFHKANSFMHSLIPDALQNKYPADLFQQVFLLIDRFSDETKRIYVNNVDKNFLSFLHVDVSNTRTQGDSCIGCKLKHNAGRMFKRSATRNSAEYWADKLKHYEKIAYDDPDKMEEIYKTESFQRLVVSHMLQNVIVNNGNSVVLGIAYDILLNIGLWMLSDVKEWREYSDLSGEERRLYGYDKLLTDIRGIEGFQIVLKVICRPFFSYDFKIRLQVLTFYLFLTELFLGGNIDEIIKDSEKKEFILDKKRLEKTEKLAVKIQEKLEDRKKLDFLQKYLFEGLTDIGSTYLMRKQTMIKTYHWVKKYTSEQKKKELKSDVQEQFWKSYSINIFRLIANNADETKELWLEYLYLCGKEYNEIEFVRGEEKVFQPQFLYKTISGREEPDEGDYYFYQFCHELFLQNDGINFDGIEKVYAVSKDNIIADKKGEAESIPEENTPVEEPIEDKYFMEYWRQKRQLEQFKIGIAENEDEETDAEIIFDSESELFSMLDSKKKKDISDNHGKTNEESVNDRYSKLLDVIVQMLQEKYKISKEKTNIALVTESLKEREHVERMQRLDIVKEEINSRDAGLASARFEIKSRIIDALEKSSTLFELEKNGYMICENRESDSNNRPYIIIFFDNPNFDAGDSAGRSLQRIERVFLYLSIARDISLCEYEYFYLRFILRDILTYRNRILRFLEKDFSGDIFARYARTSGEKNILSHEKATSHNTTADDEISVEIFVEPRIVEEYQVLKKEEIAKWLLLRNYTNGQIAKIFNRSFQNPVELTEKDGEVPEFYLNKDKVSGSKQLFKKKLDKFGKLGICKSDKGEADGRFEYISQIVTIQGLEALNDAEFLQNEEGRCFNLEYFKCILIDICISAIKFESDQADYLLRVDEFLANKERLIDAESKRDEEAAPKYRAKECWIKMYREPTEDETLDYLVILNPVDKIAHNLVDWREKNEIIQRRLRDPLDYVDGHMSMLAIKRYVENLNENLNVKCQFQYRELDEDGEKGLFFETKLPVLRREK